MSPIENASDRSPVNRKRLPRIHVIGMDPEGLSTNDIRFSRLFSDCGLLCGGDRHLKTLTGPLPDMIEKIVIRGKIAPIAERLRGFLEKAPAEDCAIVLASGDPLYHGIGSTLIREIGPEALAFYPAPTLVQRAFSLLAIPWEEAIVVSFHRPDAQPVLPDTAQKASLMAFYTDGPNGPRKVLSAIRSAPAVQERIREVIVVENIGLPEQAIYFISPEKEDPLDQHSFATLNIVVVMLDPV